MRKRHRYFRLKKGLAGKAPATSAGEKAADNIRPLKDGTLTTEK